MKIILKAFFIFVVIILVFIVLIRYQTIAHVFKNYPSHINKAPLMPTLTPTPTPAIIQAESPDGKLQLIMKTDFGLNNNKTYSFSVSDISGNNQRLLFTNAANSTESMIIPNNSWSPDDKFFYLEEDGKGWTDIFVFKTSGDSFSNGQKFLDVPSLFTHRNTGYSLKEVTGWASNTLLILYTTRSDGTQGPSFWFDVNSEGFIQLVS